MQLNYLVARKADTAECQSLKNEVVEQLINEGLKIWNDEYPSDSLIAEDISSNTGRVIKYQNEIIAYANLSFVKEEFGEEIFSKQNLYCFSRFMVKGKYRGKHVATYFIQAMLKEIKYKGGLGCGIMVHPVNKRAIQMYEKIGFRFEKKAQYPYGEFITYSYLF